VDHRIQPASNQSVNHEKRNKNRAHSSGALLKLLNDFFRDDPLLHWR
jgi:hypothetical protein